jgi:hypothetical protein
MDDGITGRDSYLIIQALFYAAHFIDGLPNALRVQSNRNEMVALLRSSLGEDFIPMAEHHGRLLKRATGRPFDVEEY